MQAIGGGTAAFGPVKKLIDLALEEDIGTGDLTTLATIPPGARGTGMIVARESLVVAGLWVAGAVFNRVDPEIRFFPVVKDGDEIRPGDRIADAEGNLAGLLTAERTVLNFLQRMSGVATHVRGFVNALGESSTLVADTRKTLPGWRVLDKYAVRMGGARNHRMGLFDGILIKDNHIAACGSVTEAVRRARAAAPHTVRVEVEVEDKLQLAEALEAGADIIMLDNMNDAQVAEAVQIAKGKALLEVSGGITLERIQALAGMGVDIISVGALTHSARNVDISLDIIG